RSWPGAEYPYERRRLWLSARPGGAAGDTECVGGRRWPALLVASFDERDTHRPGHQRAPVRAGIAAPRRSRQPDPQMVRKLAGSLAIAFIAGGAAAQIPSGAPLRDGVPTLAPILEKVTPAVVNIGVLQASPEEQNRMLRDPFFRRFFGMPGQSEPQIAAGSGVIVDAKNGYVLTNAHVVKDAREVLITLKDNRRLPAKLVGADPGTDIAVVRVEPRNLVDVRFGDSDALQVGDFVIAIGNPFGIG